MQTGTSGVTFDLQLMAEDMARKGWTKADFARTAGVADMTVIRFLRGEQQTPPTAKKLAEALGHTIDRYLISTRQQTPPVPPPAADSDVEQLALPMRRAADRIGA